MIPDIIKAQKLHTPLHAREFMWIKLALIVLALSTYFYPLTLLVTINTALIMYALCVLIYLNLFKLIKILTAIFTSFIAVMLATLYLISGNMIGFLYLCFYTASTTLQLIVFYVTTPASQIDELLKVRFFTVIYQLSASLITELVLITETHRARGFMFRGFTLRYVPVLFTLLMNALIRLNILTDSLRARGLE
ncbi:MAG: hypothetical protein B6U85_06200 [Desulfurococcales archaeon ex4484_42]|nr:MAG: hypothetical protein B6U85_06200 [Desulfurococcales archaeon ex4484_42]